MVIVLRHLEHKAEPLTTISDEEFRRRNQAAIDLLDSWERDGDEAEQRATSNDGRSTRGPRRKPRDVVQADISMNRLVVLDTGPLGKVTNPKDSEASRSCKAWLKGLLEAGVQVAVPAIADYELRRELIRDRKSRGIDRLNALSTKIGYLDINGTTLEIAAEPWAEARMPGIPTSHDKAIDGDMILTAQARLAIEGGFDAEIATTNVDHLSRFTQAKSWAERTTDPVEPLNRSTIGFSGRNSTSVGAH